MKVSPFSQAFTPEAAADLASVLKAIADPHRLRILGLLDEGPMTVVEIERELGTISQPTVSHHVGILQAAGLVSRKRATSGRVYRGLNADRMHELSLLLSPWGHR